LKIERQRDLIDETADFDDYHVSRREPPGALCSRAASLEG
jgi:hypothetical protein